MPVVTLICLSYTTHRFNLSPQPLSHCITLSLAFRWTHVGLDKCSNSNFAGSLGSQSRRRVVTHCNAILYIFRYTNFDSNKSTNSYFAGSLGSQSRRRGAAVKQCHWPSARHTSVWINVLTPILLAHLAHRVDVEWPLTVMQFYPSFVT